jgi:arylformamidase
MRHILLILCLFFTSPTAAEVSRATDLPYGPNAKNKLDVYQPSACRGDCPVVIWVHGGGWRHGTKRQRNSEKFLTAWANNNIVMVSIDYRLTPEAVHPDHIQDVASATAWVKKNISRYGGNPARINLAGHSAGAHLVALAGTSATYLSAVGMDPSELKGVFPIDTAGHDLNNVPLPVKKMVRDAFGTDPAVVREASPVYNVIKGRKYPPFILAAAKVRSDAVKTNEDLARRLQAVGGSARLHVMYYGNERQLKAHATIAQDMANMDSTMTRDLIRHVLSH